MALDHEMAGVLRAMDALGILKPAAGCTADEMRARLAPLESLRKAYSGPQVGEEDRAIAGPGGPIGLRLYRSSQVHPLPVIVYFHGGGFVLGGLDSHAHICRELAVGTGALVVSVDYRRAPEHRFPAAPEDALASVRWIAKHAGELDADGGRLALAGDSAGGNLALVTALRIRDEGGPAVRMIFAAYPGTDANAALPSRRDNANGYFLTAELSEWFYSLYLRSADDRPNPWVSPMHASNLAALPPVLLITAEYDPLRDEGELFAAKLAHAGVMARHTRYDGAIHGFLGPSTAKGRAALAEACNALRNALGAP